MGTVAQEMTLTPAAGRLPGDEHGEMQGSIAAHLLDAAETDQEQAVAHIRSCPSCGELARRLARAAAAVPLSVDQVEPPTGLRARILARCRETPRPL
jgi:hypothetical protein